MSAWGKIKDRPPMFVVSVAASGEIVNKETGEVIAYGESIPVGKERYQLLKPPAVDAGVRSLASEAMWWATVDLGLTTPRRIRWFAGSEGHWAILAGLSNNSIVGDTDLDGFVLTRDGMHEQLFVRSTEDRAKAAAIVLHEARHSWQLASGAPTDERVQADREADAREYAITAFGRFRTDRF